MDQNTHWRDSARSPRFFILDYRVVGLFFWLLLAPAFMETTGILYSLVIILILVAFLGTIEYYGFSVTVTMRYIRNTVIAGKLKKARPWWE